MMSNPSSASLQEKPKITRNRKYLACDACRSWRRKCQRIPGSETCAGCTERKIKCETTYIRKPRTNDKSIRPKKVETLSRNCDGGEALHHHSTNTVDLVSSFLANHVQAIPMHSSPQVCSQADPELYSEASQYTDTLMNVHANLNHDHFRDTVHFVVPHQSSLKILPECSPSTTHASAPRLLMLSSIRKLQNNPTISNPSYQSIAILLTIIEETWNTMPDECVPLLVIGINHFRSIWAKCKDKEEKEELQKLGLSLLAYDNCVAQKFHRLPMLSDQEIDDYFTTLSIPGTLYWDLNSVFRLPIPRTLEDQVSITCASLECLKRSLAVATVSLTVCPFIQGTETLLRLWATIQRRIQWRQETFKSSATSMDDRHRSLRFFGPAGEELAALTRLNQMWSSEQYFEFFLRLQDFLRRFNLLHQNVDNGFQSQNQEDLVAQRRRILIDIYRQCEIEVQTQYPVLARFILSNQPQVPSHTAFWSKLLIAINTVGSTDPLAKLVKRPPTFDPELALQRSMNSLIALSQRLGYCSASTLAASQSRYISEFELELERLLSANVYHSPTSSESSAESVELPPVTSSLQEVMDAFPSAFTPPKRNGTLPSRTGSVASIESSPRSSWYGPNLS